MKRKYRGEETLVNEHYGEYWGIVRQLWRPLEENLVLPELIRVIMQVVIDLYCRRIYSPNESHRIRFFFSIFTKNLPSLSCISIAVFSVNSNNPGCQILEYAYKKRGVENSSVSAPLETQEDVDILLRKTRISDDIHIFLRYSF